MVGESQTFRKLAICASLGLVIALAGCAKRTTTGSVPPNLRKPVAEMNQSELRQATDYWQKQYTRKPKDKVAFENLRPIHPNQPDFRSPRNHPFGRYSSPRRDDRPALTYLIVNQ